jgi:hypothetical protein
MKITREQLRSIVGEVLQEEKDYQSFFKAMLKKHGVESPDQLQSDDEKKEFFNKVDSAWKGISERLKEIREAELTDKQKQLDIDGDGSIEASDLAKLRAGQTAEGEEEQLPSTQIISKEGETLVKSGAGKMYNIKKVNEGKYDADLDKIEAVVKGATSFMNVGSELKKAGIKYDFTTSMIPMYMIKVSGNTIAIVNKKYAAGAEKTVGDIAIGLLN